MIRRRACELAATSVAGVIAIATSLAALPALAGPPDDPAAAGQLFSDAHDLVDQGKWDEGCPKFEASIKLHASASTAINIARCEVHFGRLASAISTYDRALTLIEETEGVERQKALSDVANQEKAALDPRVPHLTIHVDNAPDKGLDVRKDDVALDRATLDVRLPIDPGTHAIIVRAPGRRTDKESVTVAEGEDKKLAITLVVDSSPDEMKQEPTTPTPSEHRSTPVWPFVIGAAGLVSGAVAAGFLANDVSAANALRSNCYQVGTTTGCKPGYDYASDNRRKNVSGGVALGFGIVGGGLLVASVIGVALGATASAPTDAAKPSAAIVPILNGTTVGLGVVGRM